MIDTTPPLWGPLVIGNWSYTFGALTTLGSMPSSTFWPMASSEAAAAASSPGLVILTIMSSRPATA